MSITANISWRERSADETLKILGDIKNKFGISRVTDITRLDRIGIPVCAAIRPCALEGSLAVSSGKALDPDSALVGALCEAIELASAEFNASRHDVTSINKEELRKNGIDLLDFAVGSPAGLVGDFHKVDCARMTDYSTGKLFWVPADLVFIPYTGLFRFNGIKNTSNGLALGNNLKEAMLHALFELIERDACSFNKLLPMEERVDILSILELHPLLNLINQAGLSLRVTKIKNEFNLPVFISYLFDSQIEQGISVARGQGCHISQEIALLRAITESVQSRLTNIHGGRDDIVNRFRFYTDKKADVERSEYERLEARLDALPCASIVTEEEFLFPSVDEALGRILELLRNAGMDRVLFYDLTYEMSTHRVIRVVVPGLEYFSSKRPVIGKRLLAKWMIVNKC